MILLDTNIVSALMRRTPEPAVVAWLDGQPRGSVWTTSVTVLEVQFGLRILPASRRRTLLLHAFEQLVSQLLEGRIAPFDTAAAGEAATLMAERQRQGRPGDLRDTMVAGVALAHRATLATRNTRHFADLRVRVVDPWST